MNIPNRPARRAAIIACAAALLATFIPAAASAELLVAPTRIVLTPATRSAELILVNKGSEAAAFRLALENRRMRADGGLEAAAEALPGEAFAADKLRFSPRQLVLEPGARQVVRIMADTPAGLAAGEYRSHLRLVSAPVSAGRNTPVAGDRPDNSLSIELIAIRSITVPVILRIGTLAASVTLDSAALNTADSGQFIVKLSRSGSRSTYGDISLTVEGERQPAWQVRGFAIYTPNASRNVILPLPADVRARLAGKRVRIAYVSTDSAEPALAGSVLASLTAAL